MPPPASNSHFNSKNLPPSSASLRNPSHAPPASPRILIVRLGAMGDVLHALPAVAALRAALPAAHIAWVIEDRWSPLLRASASAVPLSPQQPLVDSLHLVDTRAWRAAPLARQTRRGLASFVTALRAARYDAALDLQGSIRSAVIAQLSGAPLRIGFVQTRESAASLFYTRRVPLRGRHVIEHAHGLVREFLRGFTPAGSPAAALPPAETPAPLPLDPAADSWASAELERRNIRDHSGFAILNPGAGWGAKQWPAERYGELAAFLAARGISTLINAGPAELDLASAVARAAASELAAPLACSLSQVIALTRRAHLVIAGDTGPLHVAAALRVPVLALFGPTDPARNGPLGTRAIVLRAPQSVTSLHHHDAPDPGLLSITSAQAIAALQQLLDPPSSTVRPVAAPRRNARRGGASHV